MMTAYDYPTALLLASFQPPPESILHTQSSILSLSLPTRPSSTITTKKATSPLASPSFQIDMILVGDSLSQVALGHTSTTSLTLSELIHHAQAVRRGINASAAFTTHSTPFLVSDLPFGTFESSISQGIKSSIRLVKEAQVDMVKIEGGSEIVPLVKKLNEIGVPVMPHIGLTPQRAVALSGYKVQGRTEESARGLYELALELERAGASALLLEAIPAPLAAFITSRLEIPTIGIGAGKDTSGQVLVLTDALGLMDGINQPKFVRRFAEAGREMRRGLEGFVGAVREGSFPSELESYSMKKGEWEKFVMAVEEEDRAKDRMV